MVNGIKHKLMQNSAMRILPVLKAVFILSIFLFASPVSAIEYGGFGGRPANPDPNNPRTESIFIYTLEPGQSKDDAVLVVNNTPERKTLLVYAADSTPSSGGAFACEQFSEARGGVGAWINLSKSEITLDSGTKEEVLFTLRVPVNAGVGEHNGCILIQEKKESTETKSGVNLSVRTGLRVAVTVPGEIVRNVEILGLTLSRANGKFILKPQVKNLGNVSIDADVQVVTKHWFGPVVMRHGGQYPLLKGEVSDWNFELSKP